MVDLLFANGTVIDGTGSPGYRASVAITGDTIQVITGDTSAVDAGRTIDASGYVICPGFIDMHSHSDLKLLTDPDHQPKIRQGVTTEALGMDGLSYAPTTPRAWNSSWSTWRRSTALHPTCAGAVWRTFSLCLTATPPAT